MTNDANAILHAYVRAVTSLLLGSRRMGAGVAITAGDPLDVEGHVHLAQAAREGQTDVVHLEIGAREDGYGLMGITLVASRDAACFVQTDCRLWLSKAGNRSVILPRPELRGHYRLSPRELRHIDGKPVGDMAEGIRRAEAWLEKHVRRGDAAFSNAEIHDIAVAA